MSALMKVALFSLMSMAAVESFSLVSCDRDDHNRFANLQREAQEQALKNQLNAQRQYGHELREQVHAQNQINRLNNQIIANSQVQVPYVAPIVQPTIVQPIVQTQAYVQPTYSTPYNTPYTTSPYTSSVYAQVPQVQYNPSAYTYPQQYAGYITQPTPQTYYGAVYSPTVLQQNPNIALQQAQYYAALQQAQQYTQQQPTSYGVNYALLHNQIQSAVPNYQPVVIDPSYNYSPQLMGQYYNYQNQLNQQAQLQNYLNSQLALQNTPQWNPTLAAQVQQYQGYVNGLNNGIANQAEQLRQLQFAEHAADRALYRSAQLNQLAGQQLQQLNTNPNTFFQNPNAYKTWNQQRDFGREARWAQVSHLAQLHPNAGINTQFLAQQRARISANNQAIRYNNVINNQDRTLINQQQRLNALNNQVNRGFPNQNIQRRRFEASAMDAIDADATAPAPAVTPAVIPTPTLVNGESLDVHVPTQSLEDLIQNVDKSIEETQTKLKELEAQDHPEASEGHEQEKEKDIMVRVSVHVGKKMSWLKRHLSENASRLF